MKTKNCPLSEAFADDHRHMTRGFHGLRKALDAGDVARAVAIARDIDRRVGPHIEFEERVFYPALREILGPAYVERLYAEHATGFAVLTAVLALDPDAELPEARREQLAAQAAGTLDHAVSCGTLMSRLAALDAPHRDALLSQLEEIRARGRPWTEWGAPRHGAGD